ncbi:MAG: condensation domain-containing protein, partial [Acidobacteriota bacterium]
MSDIPVDIDELSPYQQRALLVHLLQEKAGKPRVFPVSFAQQRLWLIDQLEVNNTAYNIPVVVRLDGSLNVIAFKQSIDEIVRRHEVLRTTFTTIDGQPAQVVAPSLNLTLPIVDLRDLPYTDREVQAHQLAIKEMQTPFNLSEGPLLRVTLLYLHEKEQVVLFTMHHIISDGWSMDLLIHEVVVIYRAFLDGKPSPLPELPIQYVDFAQWQRERLQGDLLQEQLSYWQCQLTGAPTMLELPTDRSRPVRQTFNGANQSLLLPNKLKVELRALSLNERATLFMTLLAAFNVLLFRYTGQQVILVGSPIANRNHREIEDLIGFFVNTLILRTDITGELSFHQLLAQVKEVALGAYAHQD